MALGTFVLSAGCEGVASGGAGGTGALAEMAMMFAGMMKVHVTMMTIIIQIFGDFLCLESDFERLAFCIKTICTSKSPK